VEVGDDDDAPPRKTIPSLEASFRQSSHKLRALQSTTPRTLFYADIKATRATVAQ
jgi:hypothetical protein